MHAGVKPLQNWCDYLLGLCTVSNVVPAYLQVIIPLSTDAKSQAVDTLQCCQLLNSYQASYWNGIICLLHWVAHIAELAGETDDALRERKRNISQHSLGLLMDVLQKESYRCFASSIAAHDK